MSLGSPNSPLAPRLAGVRVARDGAVESDKGKPNTVVSVENCTLQFVHYFNSKGQPESSLFFVTENGQYLTTVDSPEWCNKLRNMSDWMRKGVSAVVSKVLRSQVPVEVPQQDSVDILGTGEQTTGEAPKL